MRTVRLRVVAAIGLLGAVLGTCATSGAQAATRGTSVRPATTITTNSLEPLGAFGVARTGKITLSTVRVRTAATPASQVSAALSALLTVPTTSDRVFGIRSSVPGTVRVLGVQVSGHLATVNLTGAFGVGTRLELLRRTAQVVYSATSVPGVSKVAFRINGVRVGRIGSNGPSVGTGISRSCCAMVTPAALITSTRPGSHVVSPFSVSGVATSFEAVVHWRLVTLAGHVITSGVAHATANYLGHFTVTVRTSYRGSAHVVVGGDSARGDVSIVDPATTPVFIE